MMELITNRLKLRPFIEEDLNDFHEYLSCESIYVFEPGRPLNMEESRDLLRARVIDKRFWAIVVKEANKVIGNIYFEQDPWTEIETYNLGYIINPNFHNLGYCTEACLAIVNNAFNVLNAHRIEARCNIKNLSSNRVLEKVGFRLEGTLKNNVFFHRDPDGNPIWNTSNIYGLLKDEWDKV